jgi:putative colanic acid biosynthesis UDP-glucose lipid carrier transferase
MPDSSSFLRRPGTLVIARDNLLQLTEALLDPSVIVFSLWAVAYYLHDDIEPRVLILSLIVFSLTFPGPSRLQLTFWAALRDILINWCSVAALLVFFGWATRSLHYFNGDFCVTWFSVAAAALIVLHSAFRMAVPTLQRLQSAPKRTVVVGMNDQGLALAHRMVRDPYTNVELLGFFDDRDKSRLSAHSKFSVLGSIASLAAYVKANRIHQVYLSLPMTTQQRILQLLTELRDTTASIYFVPDLFVTELIQGRMGTIAGMPVVAVCETPFTGANGLLKRASDIVLSLLILLLISPILLVIALAVKFTSPGPIIFKQRRYGLDGEEILVYKFRSMTVCEDGNTIRQAQKNDQRITPLGAFLRRTSLDELPQFINVLQGRMSIVGPRPHAVAHNELYRKQIAGYMIRHKVKPGITGWAQVCGYRGETESVEKMTARIEHDLEYLRNWSLRFDLSIIVRTILVVLKDQNAY